jgi:hypothetical protein
MSFSAHVDACVIEWTYRWDYTYLVAFFVFVVPLSVIAFCYFKIFSVFWVSKSKLAQGQSGGIKFSSKERRLAVQLLILLGAFLVCWGPYFVLVVCFDRQRRVKRSVYDIVTNFLVVSSLADPCIYFFSNPIMRREAKQLLCGFIRRRERNVVHAMSRGTTTSNPVEKAVTLTDH